MLKNKNTQHTIRTYVCKRRYFLLVCVHFAFKKRRLPGAWYSYKATNEKISPFTSLTYTIHTRDATIHTVLIDIIHLLSWFVLIILNGCKYQQLMFPCSLSWEPLSFPPNNKGNT